MGGQFGQCVRVSLIREVRLYSCCEMLLNFGTLIKTLASLLHTKGGSVICIQLVGRGEYITGPTAEAVLPVLSYLLTLPSQARCL